MGLVFIFVATLAVADRATIARTEGPSLVGEVLELTADRLRLRDPVGAEIGVPISEVLAIDFGRPVRPTPPVAPAATRVLGVDGSRINAADIALRDGRAVIRPRQEVEFIVDEHWLAGVLLQPLDDEAAAPFFARAALTRAQDLLIAIAKGRHEPIEGRIAGIDSASIAFYLDGEAIKADRRSVAALFFRHPRQELDAIGIDDDTGNHWRARQARWRGGVLEVATLAGPTVRLAGGAIRQIDFSALRQRWLADLEPAIVRHTPLLDTAWPFARRSPRDRGGPASVNAPRPTVIALHSRTLVRYDLDGQERTLLARVGIDPMAGPFGDAVVLIRVDGREVWRQRVRAGEPARDVRVPIAKAGSLELFVDYGEGLDTGDTVLINGARLLR